MTTGPLPASTKVYSTPDGFPDLRVPLREIALTEKAAEPPLRVYDPSGPYTDARVEIDVTRGLPRVREAWIKERGGVEQYEGRAVKPEDNGNVSASRISPATSPPSRSPSAASPPHPEAHCIRFRPLPVVAKPSSAWTGARSRRRLLH